jgi:phosphoglycerate dehydrogenase-like enzyme
VRILFLSEHFPLAAELLTELLPGDEVVVSAPGEAPAADVLVPQMVSIDGPLLDRVRPRMVLQFGVGLEGVDREAAAARGIPVDNIPAANAVAVAEIAVLHLLSLTRRTREGAESVAAGRLGSPVGPALAGRRIVVLGRGAIGTAVAACLRPFGAEIELVGSRRPERLPAALEGALALIVCCSLTPASRGLIATEALAALPRGAYLVNVARGAVVDYDALLAALRSGELAGAGLDVYWREPIDPADPLLAENVSLTPHVGGVSRESYREIAERFAEKVEALRSAAGSNR